MEMSAYPVEATQMETNVHREDQVIKSKEAETHTMEGQTHLEQHGLENTQGKKGDFHNGKSCCCDAKSEKNNENVSCALAKHLKSCLCSPVCIYL